MRFIPEKPPIFEETLEALGARITAQGHPAFRAAQVMDWLYKKRVHDPDAMSNLPKALREWLASSYDFAPNAVLQNNLSGDITQKLLQRLRDGSLIETVIIRAPQEGVGAGQSRKTICLSTQVGCAYGCRFCASGLKGLKRNLGAGEIVAQLMAVCRMEDSASPERTRDGLASFDNIVVMGMGEPLANYDNLLAALRLANSPWALGFGARRITVSTSGVVPRILQLAEDPLGVRLAISLHGATNDVRNRIMPVNLQYPLETLLPACEAFSRRHGRMLTLEFILIAGVNDTREQALALAGIARRLHAHVNLIPHNTVDGLHWERPSRAQQQRFEQELKYRGASVTLRREKGHDIDAACGQLRLRQEAVEHGAAEDDKH